MSGLGARVFFCFSNPQIINNLEHHRRGTSEGQSTKAAGALGKNDWSRSLSPLLSIPYSA